MKKKAWQTDDGRRKFYQEKGRISSQDIPAGRKIEQYTTLKYHLSKGQQEVVMPDLSGETGIDAQQTLEDLGLNVTVQKEYSEDVNRLSDGKSGYVFCYTGSRKQRFCR